MKGKELLVLVFGLVLLLVLVACDNDQTDSLTPFDETIFYYYGYSKEAGEENFDFPGNYQPPELVVDGEKDDAYDGAPRITYGDNDNVTVSIYRGESALFFYFEVTDDRLLTYGYNAGDDVTRGDSIEIYLDTKNDGGNGPRTDDYQINIGVHGKARLLSGSGGVWGPWNGLIDYAVVTKGTVNDEEIDEGYIVEVMVPYDQIDITKDNDIGLAFGHVNKTSAGNVAGKDFTWTGWTYKGQFVNPQIPNRYVVWSAKDNQLYLRDEVPQAPITIKGKVIEKDSSTVISDVKVKLLGTDIIVTTDQNGVFILENVSVMQDATLIVEKEGYITYQYTYTSQELKAVEEVLELTIELMRETNIKRTTIKGVVKNAVMEEVAGVNVTVKGTSISTLTNENGEFTLEDVPAAYDVQLILSKEGFETAEYTLSDLVIDGVTELNDALDLRLLPSEFSFGGQRGINAFDATITRGLEGIVLNFVTETKFEDGEWIEFFIDTKHSNGLHERDHTDYLIIFRANGTIQIINWNGSNDNVETSGIVLKVIQKEDPNSGARVEAMIPYTFLGIEPTEVFGISAGVFGFENNGNSSWDGWGFEGEFVPPENPSAYVRVGLYNELYRWPNNEMTIVVDGTVVNNNLPLVGVQVAVSNYQTVTDSEGRYSLRIPLVLEDVVLTLFKPGFEQKEVDLNFIDPERGHLMLNLTLEERFVTIKGTVVNHLSGVQIRVEGFAELNAVSDENGHFTIQGVPTTENVTIVATKAGYHEYRETVMVHALYEDDEIDLTIQMIPDSEVVTIKGTVRNVLGSIDGVRVSVVGENLSTTTESNGTFVLSNVPVKTIVLQFEKEGYLTRKVEVDGSILSEGEYELDDIDLMLDFAVTPPFSGKETSKGRMTQFTGYFTRALNGFYFEFHSNTVFGENGFEKIELFIDTKTSAGLHQRDYTDYRIDIGSNGQITAIENYGGGNTDSSSIQVDIDYEIIEGGTVVKILIPYDFLGVEQTEVIGISLGVWSDYHSDWDGWAFAGEFVAPENPQKYVRFSADNHLYVAINNE